MVTIWLMGFHALNPFNIDWVRGDVAQTYLGWAYFRQDPNWSFPLTFTRRLSYPLGSSVSYNNSIPLVAVLLKPFTHFFPRDFQYQGLFALACAVLQAVFGFRICQRFARDDLKALLGCLFIVTAPTFVFRFSMDLILLCQWPILAAIWLYLKQEGTPNSYSSPLRYSLLLAIVGGINPYLAVMCMVVMSAAVYCDIRNHRPWAIRRILVWALPVAALLGSWVIFGFLQVGGKNAEIGLGGYGDISMNLLSPVNPRFEMAGNPLTTESILFKGYGSFPLQYEGYNYLGAGIILLIAGTFLLGRRVGKILGDPILKPLWAVAGISLMMALTTRVTWGHTVLVDLPLPYYPVKRTLSIFRSAGRFFWPAYYIILIAFLQYFFRSYSRRRVFWVLSGLLCLQLVDTSSLRRLVYASLNPPPAPSMFQDAFWDKVEGRFDKLIVLPAWQAMPDDSSLPGGRDAWLPFGFMAAAHGMALNVNYQARPNAKDDDIQRNILPAAVEDGKLDDDTLYVLGPRYLLQFCDRGFTHIVGKSVDRFSVFWNDSAKEQNLEGLDQLLKETLDRGVDFKQVAVGFESPQSAIPYLLDSGFALPEGKFTSSLGPKSQIPLFLSRNPKLKRVILYLVPVIGRDVVSQKFSVSLGKRRLGDYELRGPEKVTIDIPDDAIKETGRTGVAYLTFDWRTATTVEHVTERKDSRSASALRKFALTVGLKSGLSGDQRLFAMGIHAMEIQASE